MWQQEPIWFWFGPADHSESPFPFFCNLSRCNSHWGPGFYLVRNCQPAHAIPFPRGDIGSCLHPPCCVSAPVASTRPWEIRKHGAVLSIAHRLILLIAFFPMIICPLSSSLLLKDHFLPSLMLWPFLWLTVLFLDVFEFIKAMPLIAESPFGTPELKKSEGMALWQMACPANGSPLKFNPWHYPTCARGYFSATALTLPASTPKVWSPAITTTKRKGKKNFIWRPGDFSFMVNLTCNESLG